MFGIPEFAANVAWFAPGVVLSVIVGYLVRGRVAGWLGTTPALGWALVVSLGLIVSATLTPLRDGLTEEGRVQVGCDLSRMAPASLAEILRFDDPTRNIALFIPLGVVLGLAPRRRRTAILLVAAVVLPVIIETTQLVVAPLDRACQSGDVFDNLTGLVIGLGIGSVAQWMAARSPTDPPPSD